MTPRWMRQKNAVILTVIVLSGAISVSLFNWNVKPTADRSISSLASCENLFSDGRENNRNNDRPLSISDAARLKAFLFLENPQYETAVEFELWMEPAVLRLITTSNELLGGALKPGESMPPEFLESFEKRYRGKKDPMTLPFDRLSDQMKLFFMVSLSKARGQVFFQDRVLHGFRAQAFS